jgi:hypothetical protein
MKDRKESINLHDKTIIQNVKKYGLCGESYVHINEYERVRNLIYPSILDRIKIKLGVFL